MRPRVIPILLLDEGRLVKSMRFGDLVYVGDPVNVVRIFNEKEVDELAIIDISASVKAVGPDMDLLEQIASEAFMPVAYGGGISGREEAGQLFRLGFEKVVLQSLIFSNPTEVELMVDDFGAQSIVAALDFCLEDQNEYFLRPGVSRAGSVSAKSSLRDCGKIGVGEILITAVDREGTREGLDLRLLEEARPIVSCPLVLNGGAKDLEDVGRALEAGADAVGAGALFTFLGPFRSVMINYPTQKELRERFG